MHAEEKAHVDVGKTEDGTDVSGSITVPECAYDTEPDDYVVRSDSQLQGLPVVLMR